MANSVALRTVRKASVYAQENAALGIAITAALYCGEGRVQSKSVQRIAFGAFVAKAS